MNKKIIVLSVIVAIILAVVVFLAIKTPLSEPKIEESPSTNNNVDNSVPADDFANVWKDADKPSQSPPIEDQSQIPQEAIKVAITEQGIVPASFEAKKGGKIMLSVSSADQWTHIFKFKSDVLKEVAVGVGPEETRGISFFAPKEAGEYEYYCDVPGHIERGEKGIMVVK